MVCRTPPDARQNNRYPLPQHRLFDLSHNVSCEKVITVTVYGKTTNIGIKIECLMRCTLHYDCDLQLTKIIHLLVLNCMLGTGMKKMAPINLFTNGSVSLTLLHYCFYNLHTKSNFTLHDEDWSQTFILNHNFVEILWTNFEIISVRNPPFIFTS